MRWVSLSLLIVLLACLAAGPVFASACSNPAGNEADEIYNGDYHVWQFCNGTNWINAGAEMSPDTIAAANEFGDTNIESTGDSGNANLLIAQEATLALTGTLQSLSFFVDGAAGNLVLGIYDATGSGGGPGNLLAATAGFTPTVGWNTQNVVTPVALSPGNYWLAYNPSSNSLGFVNNGGVSGNCENHAHTYGGSLPATFPSSPSSCTPQTWSFYATLAGGCASPAGNEGDLIYNKDYHTEQFCNGASWIQTEWVNGGGGGGGCSNPAGKEADLIYNQGSYHTPQFCNGTNWVPFGGPAWASTPGAGSGYFVMSKSTWNGNLGGLAGADALCLTELTTNTGWKGYADANARGLLVSGNVHAFLCDAEGGGSTCTSPAANTTFYYADANNSAHGGNSFTTDASQLGPYDVTPWSNTSYFGADYIYWTGRAGNYIPGNPDANIWSTNYWGVKCGTNGNQGCACSSQWSSASSSNLGLQGYAGTGGSSFGMNRWFDLIANNIACNQQAHLICFVNP
jgi:hypothetical protein